jgi:riboflavin synthase
MFTGIVEDVGTIRESGSRLRIESRLFAGLEAGASVAVNGTCLTLTEPGGATGTFFVSPETFSRTNLASLGPGDTVNLERALLPTTRISGHFVQGHIDGVGTIRTVERRGETLYLEIDLPDGAAPFCIEKGSIAIDGVSLTINSILGNSNRRSTISLLLIPHTIQMTRFRNLPLPGTLVNVEYDVLGKYAARQRGVEL